MLRAPAVKVAYMATTFAERLKRALDESGKSRSDLARVLRSPKGHMGVSESAIGQLLDGTSKSMNAENCVRAARFLQVNPYWFATGEGAMADSYGVQKPPRLPVIVGEMAPPYLSAEEVVAHLGCLFGEVPIELRSTFADTLHAWARSGGEDDRQSALLYLLRAPRDANFGKQANAG